VGKGSNLITWSYEERDTTVQESAIFGPEGTDESRESCRYALEGWVGKTPRRAEQWDLIKDDYLLVWKALERAFGLPKKG